MKYVTTPPSEIVGITTYKGKIIIACKNGVYWLSEKVLIPIRFEVTTEVVESVNDVLEDFDTAEWDKGVIKEFKSRIRTAIIDEGSR